MKPFYIYKVEGKVNFQVPIKVNSQTSLIEGKAREPQTMVKLNDPKYLNSYNLLTIKHDVRQEQYGITTAHFGNEVRTIVFNDYLIPEEFNACYSDKDDVIIFQARGKTCRSAVCAINEIVEKFEICKVPFNFEIAHSLVKEYKGAWFKNINANVSAIGMSGQDVQEDEYFEMLKEQGDLSNISINFEYAGDLHQVMITQRSGVILYRKYNNQEIETDLVIKVFEEIIKKVWKLDPEVDY